MAEITDRAGIRSVAEELHAQGKTIVTMNGSFDVLHIGHVRCLQEARQLGDVLIVAINSDSSIQGYKGKERPLVSQDDRAEMIAALSCVDYVVLFDDGTPKAILSEIRPDIHCNGADWGPGCIEREVVEQNGGRLHVLSWSPGRSTSELFDRIRSSEASPGALIVRKSLLANGGTSLLKVVLSSGLKLVLFADKEDAPVASAPGIKAAAEYTSAPPDTGMLSQARDDLGLALGSSWVVSDDMRHIVMAREANARTILIGVAPEGYLQPHAVAEDLAGALSVVAGR